MNTIITDLAVIDVTARRDSCYARSRPGFTPDDVQQFTEPKLHYTGNVPEMTLRKALISQWIRYCQGGYDFVYDGKFHYDQRHKKNNSAPSPTGSAKAAAGCCATW